MEKETNQKGETIRPLTNYQDPKESEAIVLSAANGRSFTNRSGAENGPREILKNFENHLEWFDRFTQNEPNSFLKVGFSELERLNKLSTESALKEIERFYAENQDKFILMLGGSHSVSIGAFNFFSKFFNPQEVTVLQVDAHADLRDDFSDFKENSTKFEHGCVMRRAFDLNFNLVQVGIRAYSVYEHEFIQKNNLKVFEWGRKKVPEIKEIIAAIKTEKVYLTFDIDGLDPAHAPATGTPVPGGLEWFYALELIRELASNKIIVGADIVEVSPFKEDVLTQYSAAHLCYNILAYKLMKDKGLLKFY